MGGMATVNDIRIIFPNLVSYTNPGTSVYTGVWNFSFYVPNQQKKIDIWDGDFDRGTSVTVSQDTDDPNTEGKPAWATSSAVNERAGGRGAPADNFSSILFVRGAPVTYTLIDPGGAPIYTNQDPSGTEEWEKYTLGTDNNDSPDQLVAQLQPGVYQINVTGLDNNNAVWLRVNFPICDPDEGCGPREWPEGSCPRTIGYWKNNVNKIYIQNATAGTQETKESLDAALKFVAIASPLYRSGINVANPEPIASPTPLTPQEADTILQRKANNYPDADPRSMLARALQQNLATWLNLASGKIGPTTVVTLNVYGGAFEGTILEALEEAQAIIIAGDLANLERAKDIGDQINNGLLGENAATSVCTDYVAVMPPEKQPPAYGNMPKAPKQNEPQNVPPGQAPVCTAGNTYAVENPAAAPFNSVKFSFTSGTAVNMGGYDTFKYSLPTDQVAALTSVQVEVTAGSSTKVLELTGDFTSPLGGGEPLGDDEGKYAVSFMGATDNGDGTTTLAFDVYVKGQDGLSSVAFGLPEGQTAGGVTESFTTEACVAP